MNINNRRIATEEMKIGDFVGKIMKGEFVIPSFQREFVWEADDIIKLRQVPTVLAFFIDVLRIRR